MRPDAKTLVDPIYPFPGVFPFRFYHEHLFPLHTAFSSEEYLIPIYGILPLL